MILVIVQGAYFILESYLIKEECLLKGELNWLGTGHLFLSEGIESLQENNS